MKKPKSICYFRRFSYQLNKALQRIQQKGGGLGIQRKTLLDFPLVSINQKDLQLDYKETNMFTTRLQRN